MSCDLEVTNDSARCWEKKWQLYNNKDCFYREPTSRMWFSVGPCCCCFIVIIITLFESQIILAEHECCTNWGDCKSNKSNQIKCWFLRRGENRSSRRKTSRSRVENQQTQPTYDAGSGNRTRDTLVEGERSHHYTNPAPCRHLLQIKMLLLQLLLFHEGLMFVSFKGAHI